MNQILVVKSFSHLLCSATALEEHGDAERWPQKKAFPKTPKQTAGEVALSDCIQKKQPWFDHLTAMPAAHEQFDSSDVL